ncbi:MAG: hypothetical protein IT548_04835 [Alphaproteobacteria bacterium]|nr:hypothetical protein [Alphaproteobacteria bacterium]
MSYDLYLASPGLTEAAFDRHFSGRPHYEAPGSYANDDTGVYFSFDFAEGDVEDDADPEAPDLFRHPHVAFSLNYFRPHAFGLEAVAEVSAFVAAFDCAVHDPQVNGMDDGPYSDEAFLRGWNTGNAFGYRALSDKLGDDLVVADDDLIEQVWRWNFDRHVAQAKMGNALFVLRLTCARHLGDGSPIVYATWTEGVMTALPEYATHAVLVRRPRRSLFSLFSSKRDQIETKLVSIAEVAALEGCTWCATPIGRVLLAPAQVPPSRAVRAAFEGGFPGLGKYAKPLPFDHVLNASLIASHG